jgi:hypothetical protein
MECDTPSLLEQWTACREDLGELEMIPAVTSAEELAAVAPRRWSRYLASKGKAMGQLANCDD